MEVGQEDVKAPDFDDITTINVEAIHSLPSNSWKINHLIGLESRRLYVFNQSHQITK